MISILLIVLVAQAEYLMTTYDEYMNVYQLDKCYYTGSNTYTKYSKDGKKVRSYTSTMCDNWVDHGPYELNNNQFFVKNLPEYSAVVYSYLDAEHCTIKGSGPYPIEMLIKPGCVKTSETSSSKSEFVDDWFIKNIYDESETCTGTPTNVVKIGLGICVTNDNGLYYTIRDSAMTYSMLFAVLLAFII
ncbi:hypothetical protein EIN_383010 [Entamoeba invadens IP1]|uniref:Uncharacterized protein n=1 Tax=Entamoeba invadens IP1 TaxID=370355 RepID=A0A0A1U0X8_ENTIV|nr:hypothetical protein EIN_383010 [Entamoeba invadens IP1]ELP87687.1 hypothetical protein EIN_383010 [Entamoeba invadens IP1]|eukprot:XP_004254458.1 hypothetical protein EIN_383010 [Entamoeba invadens IP1]